MNVPLQQTRAWEKLQHELGETTFFKETEDFIFLAILKKTRLGNYFYLPYGPVLKHKTAAKTAYKALESLARENNVSFMRIEPQDPKTASYFLKLPNLRKSTDLNPAHTWVLDLAIPKEQLISNFSQGTRTRYNQASKKGLTVTLSKNPDDIKELVRLQHKLAHEKGINTFSEAYLKAELQQSFASLYLVHYRQSEPETNSASKQKTDDKIIAASLFFDHDGVRYYMQSASDYEYHRLPATVALLAAAIFDAKAKGLNFFDFWGIAPENAPKNHPWIGFTKFKKSFGGEAKSYVGTYDLILNRPKYTLYNLVRKLNRFFRKLKA